MVEIRELDDDMEYLEINEALIAEVHESEVLYELLVYEFELPEDFDLETEILSDDQLRFTVYYQEIVQILRDTRDELEEAYDGLELIEPETEAPTDEEVPTDNDDELDDEDETYPFEEDDDEDLMTLEEARADLREFLVYLNSILDEEDFTEIEWEEWQNLIEQANRVLTDSDELDEISEMLELLIERYHEFVNERLPVRELLSITRPEFEEMTPAEIVELAEEGGYVPVGIMSDTAPRARSGVVNVCPNLDGGNFVSNVIVDGVVCVGMLEGFTPFSISSVATGPDFVAAWSDPTVTDIILLGDIMLHGATTGGVYPTVGVGALTGPAQQRTTPVHINGNGRRLTLRSTGTTTGNAIHPRLVLGAPVGGESNLELTNINIGRVATANSAANMAAAPGRAAQAMALITSTDAAGWNIYIHDNVGTSVTGATIGSGAIVTNAGSPPAATPAANSVNRSGFINAPGAHLIVTGENNLIRSHQSETATGDGNGAAVFINVGHFTMQNGAQLNIIHPSFAAATGQTISATNVDIGNTANLDINRTSGAGHAINATGTVTTGTGSMVVINRGGDGHAINATGAITASTTSTINITRSGIGAGINASGIVTLANTNITMTTAGGGHGISGSEVIFRDSSNIMINRTAGTGHGINATGAVTAGTDATINITRTAGGAGINATGAVTLANTTINMTTGGAGAGIVGSTVTVQDNSTVVVDRAGGDGQGIHANGAGTTGAINAGNGSTITVIRSGAGSGIIGTGAVILENTNITMTTAGGGHGISGSSVTFRDGSNITVNRTGGAGRGVNATTNVITGENTTMNITTNGTGHGIYTTGTGGRVEFGSHSEINVTRTGGGTAVGSGGLAGAQPGHRLFAAATVAIHTDNLLIEENADVTVTTTGAGHGLWIQNLELMPGVEPVDNDALACTQDITTTSLNIRANGNGAAVRVRNNGEINVGENARFCIANTSTADMATDVDHDDGDFRRGHGLFGDIRIFTMEANSFMNINTPAVGFRSRVSTTYTMRDGSRKIVYSRRADRTSTNQGRSAWVLASSYTTGTSTADSASRRNHSHDVLITGEGTLLRLEGYAAAATNSSTARANLKLFGDDSTFHVTDGAKLNNLSHNTTAMLFFGEGTDFRVNENSSMNITVRGSADNAAGAFRFLQAGSQTFTLDGGEVSVIAYGSTAALLRAFGGNNAFYVTNGGLLELIHRNTTSTGAHGVDFSNGDQILPSSPTVQNRIDLADRFIVEGYRSEVFIDAHRIGVSGSDQNDVGTGGTGSVNTVTRVEATDGAVFVVYGNTPGADGIFNAGRLHITLDEPLFFDFMNRNTTNGLIFNTNSSSAHPSILRGINTDLALWRNNRPDTPAGSAPTGLATADPHLGNPGGFWSNMDFTLRPNEANFANTGLLAGGGSTSEPRFTTWFNSPANMPGTGDAHAGWRQIRRMQANNAHPIVDILRTPTDADQRIFGHITIPEGNRSARSAFDDEVFVDLVIKNPVGVVVQEIFNAPTGTRSIYGGPEHAGIFEAIVDFGSDSGFEDETMFLPAGYTVEVVTARRSADGLDGMPGGDGRENYREACHPAHITSEDYPLCNLEGILTGIERVRDITPPEQVEDVEGLVDGLAPGREGTLDGPVLTASTSITGTGEPGALVRVARVTPSTGNAVVTAVSEWLGEPVEVDEDGEWEFMIPLGINLVAGERLSIYISDDEGLEDLYINSLDPDRTLPEVIYRRGLVPDPEGEPGDLMRDPTLDSRIDVLFFRLPRTAATNATTNPPTHPETPPWAGSTMGNINFHWNQRTEFHDATEARGNQGFDYAYILTVEAALEIDFMWNYPDSEEDYFYQDVILPGQTVNRPTPNPDRELYHFLCWSTTPNGGCGPDSDEFDFTTELDEDATLYAQWLGQQAFSFIKTDQLLYEDFANKERLEGAVFKLERGTYVPGECDIWEDEAAGICETYEPGEYDWDYVMTATSEDAPNLGRVNLLLVPGFRYRLTEIAQPSTRFLLPDGHWYIDVAMVYRAELNNTDQVQFTPQIEAYDDEWDEDFENLPPFYYRDGTWFVGNMLAGNEFRFTKTNDYLYMDLDANYPTHINLDPLSGAEFELRYWDEENEEWSAVIATGTSDSNGLVILMRYEDQDIEYLLTVTGRYQLVETRAPSGFRLPHGYWIITWDETTERFNMQAGGTISLVPAFRAITCTLDSEFPECEDREAGDIVYLVGNFPITDLPATGGLGAMTLTLIGGLGLAFVVLLYLRGKASDELSKLEEAA